MQKFLLKCIGKTINITSYFSSNYAATLAYKLFSTPRKGQITNNANNYLESATQEDIHVNDFTIRTYHWSGENDIILLAHGWESNSYRWKDLIETLKIKNYNIVAIDAPAHGNSGNKSFNALLYSQCIYAVAKKFKPHAIIGHSIGGTSSIFALHNHDMEFVNKLVTLGSPSQIDTIVNNYFTMMGFNNKVKKALNVFFLEHFGHLPEYFKAQNFLNGITAKGLVIHDKADKIISYADALDYKKYYKNAEFVKTTGLGHGLKSDMVYKHITDFLSA